MLEMEIRLQLEAKMKSGKKIPISTHDYADMQEVIKELKKVKYIVNSHSNFNFYAFMVKKEYEKR